MRRTVLLALATAVLVGSTGAAGATRWAAGTDDGQQRGPDRATTATAATASQAGVPTAANPAPRPPASPDVPPLANALAQPADVIGTIETVTGSVLHATGQRSMTLHYPGADYVKVHFTRLLMLPGDRVTVADPAGHTSFEYTEKDLIERDDWAMSVDGDTAVVTMRTESLDPLGLRSRLAGVGLLVDKVARGLTETERAAKATDGNAGMAGTGPRRTGREESICGRFDQKVDAVCYKSSHPVQYAHAKPVARVLINGIELCTAWRVGPANRMFTNAHCFRDSSSARRTEVWFNYQCAQCGGFSTLRPVKVLGDEVLASDGELDYTLFTVRDFEMVTRFGYLQIDPNRPQNGTELYIPQHPRGAPTMIAMEDPGERTGNCAVDNPAYDGYAQDTDVSYFCDTEGGSSGSPVISRETNMVIALHHFGGCPNSGVRMDLIAEQVAEYL